MPESNLEKIYDYVDTAQFMERDDWFQGLDLAERQIAADAVVIDRAQMVVDHAAAVLTGRLACLESKKQALESQLEIIGQDISIIKDAIKVPIVTQERDTLASRRLHQRAEAGQHWNRLAATLADEPPFRLDMSQLREMYPNFVWDERYLQSTYEGQIPPSALSRVGLVFIQTIIRQQNFFDRCERDGFLEAQRNMGNGIEEIVVKKPLEFFEEAMSLNNFGPKSVVSTLCIADMQAEARRQNVSIKNILPK